MGHEVPKELYAKLGKKVDNLTFRAPWNDTFFEILKNLFSASEAELIIKMPYGFNSIHQIQKVTGYETVKLQNLLDSLCMKGLVMDIKLRNTYRYIISPMIIGIFEYTMMRTDKNLDFKKVSALFEKYMFGFPDFYQANFKPGTKVSVSRVLPYDEAYHPDEYTEVMDYEKAKEVITRAKKFALGTCSCRHVKHHTGEKSCDVPLDTCTSFGLAADFLIRHNFSREISKAEMLENLARSKDMGLVLCADNVKKNVSFICHCCGCCCHLLQGITRFGCANTVITSNYIAMPDLEKCTGCGKCAKACPIDSISMIPNYQNDERRKKKPEINHNLCLGCGVCALKCPDEAIKLVKRKSRVLQPATTFERLILQCLERGTLQNFLFKNPQSITHAFMRGLMGGFLRLPPVKKAFMSDILRSRFLSTMARFQ